MNQCPKCNQANRPQARFCVHCGNTLPQQQPVIVPSTPASPPAVQRPWLVPLIIGLLFVLALLGGGAYAVRSGGLELPSLGLGLFEDPTPTPTTTEIITDAVEDAIASGEETVGDILGGIFGGEDDTEDADEENGDSGEADSTNTPIPSETPSSESTPVPTSESTLVVASTEEIAEITPAPTIVDSPDPTSTPDSPTVVPTTARPEDCSGYGIPGTDLKLPCVTDEDEIEIGRDVDEELLKEYTVYVNEAELERVTNIGNAILPYSDRPHLPYKYTLLDTNEINAFAVPGGSIYVTRGMLEFVENNDELASIMGHEIAHIGRRHSARQIEAVTAAEFALRLLTGALDLETIYEDESAQIATLITAQLLFSGWGRNMEYEADEYGVIYMAHAGYNPRAAITLFQRIEVEFPTGDGDVIDRMTSTHPPFPDRVTHIEEVIVENGLE